MKKGSTLIDFADGVVELHAYMIAALVLISGVLLVTLVGTVLLIYMGTAQVLPSLVPLIPWVVMAGTVMLTLTDLLLFFGDRNDRRTAVRDLGYLLPTLAVSAALWWVAQKYLW